MATAPTPDELGPLLAESADLDTPLADPYDDEDGEYMAAAMTAVGSESKATALKDAIESCLRSHGLLSDADQEGEDDDGGASDVGAGFEDL